MRSERARPESGGGRQRRGAGRERPEGREEGAQNVVDVSHIAGGPARKAAIDLALLVEDGRSLDEALLVCRAFNDLDGPDRGFARALASTVLRRRGTIDAIIGDYLDRPIAKRARRAMHILRIAAAQLLFLETPPHAAVSTAVDLTRAYKETASLSGVVNAITRKIADAGKSKADALPLRVDTAGWLWRSWERRYGPATTRRIAEAHRARAPIDLTIKDPARLPEFLERTSGRTIGAGSIRLNGEPTISDLPGYANGDWWVQDAAAALPAKLFGDINGQRVLDLCAAPGGKTMQLAAAGANVTAIDQSATRLDRLKANLKRTGLEAEIIEGDVRTYEPATPFDAVLLDAPCTATGTIRRHPDVMWSKTADQLAALSELQAKMIDRAAGFVRPGGALVYCVCSLQPEEGEAQAEAALQRTGKLRPSEIDAGALGDFADAVTGHTLRTTPAMLRDKGGCDGFFAARFEIS
ncbi:MAG: transcription antitermination factor NusB [Pseudomonadota bacterium]